MIIIAGIFRTGLSMTMQMLDAGGFPCVGEGPAFEEFPLGQIPWGSLGAIDPMFAIKLVDTPKQFPTPGMEYDVIRLRRDYGEMVKSFNKFNLALMGLPPIETRAGVQKLFKSFQRDNIKMDRRFRNGGHRVLELRFEDIVGEPLEAAEKMIEFIEWRDHPDMNAEAMAGVVLDRTPECGPELLELQLLDRYK